MMHLILNSIAKIMRLVLFKKQWKRNNRHNYTSIGNVFPISAVRVGKMTYGRLNVNAYGNKSEMLSIGSYCSIAGEVKFLLGGEHSYKTLSTFPVRKYLLNEEEITKTKGPIFIGDDVWIGERSIILSGVTVGQGAIIGAGSVVSHDIPPYAIYAGNRIIRYRFDEQLRERLCKVNLDSLINTAIASNPGFLLDELNCIILDKFESMN